MEKEAAAMQKRLQSEVESYQSAQKGNFGIQSFHSNRKI